MVSRTEYLVMRTARPREFVNLTERVREIVRASGVAEGLVLVSSMHITSAVFVNDNEAGLLKDIEAWAERLAPKGDYLHHRTGETNGDAHLKNLLLGHQVVLPVTRGDLDLGPWEQLFYGEFDGQRPKRVVVKVVGDGPSRLELGVEAPGAAGPRVR
jgi:secondary thiamine-phosphate synthase enzyme